MTGSHGANLCVARLGVFLLVAVGLVAPCQASDWNAGPLQDAFPLTWESGRRTEWLGPLFSHQVLEPDPQTETRWTPLLSHTKNPATDHEEWDLAYPLLTYDRFGEEYRLQVIQWLSWAGGQSQTNVAARRFTLFPFYFQSRSEEEGRNYTALMPFYGTLKNRFFRDKVHFVMLPLYVQSRKRDVVTDNFAYPFFHLREGPGLHGWQLWPLIGHEHKSITTRTNGWDEAESVPGHDKWFGLWPFFFRERLAIGSENPVRKDILLPFYALTRSPDRDSSTYLWPFVSYTVDREKNYREFALPWPLVVFARGEGKTGNRVWPFFSRIHNDSLESRFALWPLYKYNRAQADALDRERTRVLFFLYSNLRQENRETGATRQRRSLWPLFHWSRDLEGRSHLRLLAPLEPLLPEHKSIERNYAPVWSLYQSRNNPATGDRSRSFLWNLYRREIHGQSKKDSLFFGLIQYQSGAEGRKLRLFHLPRESQPPSATVP